MSDRFAFSTDVLPERDRFPLCCEEIIRLYAGLDLITRDRSQFRASIELQRAGAVNIGYNATTPVDCVRSPDLVRRDGDDGLCFILLESGSAHQTQCDEDTKLSPGDAIVCDSGYAGELNILACSRFWNLKIPRKKIADSFPRFTRFAGAPLDKDPSARRLLFGYLSGAFKISLPADESASRLYESHIVDLIALAFGVAGDARELAERRGVRAVREAAIMREIETSAADATLDAEVVARRLGVTARYVHVLLEPSGRTFSEHLLDKRLEHAAKVLRSPRLWGLKIADIAFQAGFTDLSHFNRTFRRKYGATPTEMRDVAQRQDRS